MVLRVSCCTAEIFAMLLFILDGRKSRAGGFEFARAIKWFCLNRRDFGGACVLIGNGNNRESRRSFGIAT